MAIDLRPLGKLILRSLKAWGSGNTKPATRPSGAKTQTRPAGVGGSYPGDFRGPLRPKYSPKPDGQPDPGEIVWGWVPYEEDYSRGKDRPVLLVGADAKCLLGLMLTSKDHDHGARADDYVDIGAGAWDRQGRPSEVKVDRVIRLDPASIRREGAVLERALFNEVSRALRAQQDRR
ncbi:type II toxin-antitoxin system PemK/MazF family toxin [Arthrobacter sp. fls2-241-R2A-172]|uniref:type II toxin-antitoxin system PemK/MazF family toxin n=1 Tax=Arthrobacter sp. fls2-241-R2A-172 TaxID=3040325 RepID=UPI00254F9636|nr:type II toxin-antitoxin system PemK/MazF family toxin [Arthrobacter sp. fls2-241-R2A-172]